MSDLQFRILGPVEIRRDGEAVALGTPKQRTLLVALLLHANQVLSMDQITDLLWEDDPPPSAQANVRTYCLRLRRALADTGHVGGSRLISRRPGYLIDARPGELDLACFDEQASAARALLHRGAMAEAAERLAAALAQWRGPAAQGVRRVPPMGAWLAALDDQRGDAVEALAVARLASGRHGRRRQH